jgi:DNA-binding SARP family transcriptional activator/streptogramin lyase
VEFRILGQLEVDDDGRPVSIRRGKERALLIYLLLHPNEVLPSGRLIDALWDERPPATAAKILQNAVSHLRKELGDGRLITTGPGYLFRLEEGELDLQRFERLAKEGRGEEALALWRGPPLLDLRDERFADEARRRLEEQRLAVLEDRIDDDLAAGRHAKVVPELEQLVGEHPLRERLQGQLMRALYGAGRQTDALEAYRQARRTLSEELGLEPGPQLQELERKILTQDPELAPPPAERRRARSTLAPARARRRVALLGLAGALLVVAATSLALIHAFGGDAALRAKQNSLVVIDPHGNRIVGVVPVGKTPRGLAVGRKAVWVTNASEGTVTEIGLKHLNVIQTIGLGAQATDAVVADGGVWVVTGIDNTVVHLDERSGGIVERLKLSGNPAASSHSVATSTGAIWAASGGRIVKIDARTGSTIAVNPHLGCCNGVNDVAFGAGAVWVADVSEQVIRVSQTDGRSTGSVALGTVPVAVTVAYGSVWVTVIDDSYHVALWGINPQTVRITQTITIARSVGLQPTMEVAAGDGSLWVTNYNLRTVTRIDPNDGTIMATIKIGRPTYGVAFGANRVWVTVS